VTGLHLQLLGRHRVTDKRDKEVFDTLTQEDFTLANVPCGGRELTFIQENGGLRVLDAEGKILAEGKALTTVLAS
jgi:hypothetical protein